MASSYSSTRLWRTVATGISTPVVARFSRRPAVTSLIPLTDRSSRLWWRSSSPPLLPPLLFVRHLRSEHKERGTRTDDWTVQHESSTPNLSSFFCFVVLYFLFFWILDKSFLKILFLWKIHYREKYKLPDSVTTEELLARVRSLDMNPRTAAGTVKLIARRLLHSQDKGVGAPRFASVLMISRRSQFLPRCVVALITAPMCDHALWRTTDGAREVLDRLMEWLMKKGDCSPSLCSVLMPVLGSMEQTDRVLALFARMTSQGYVSALGRPARISFPSDSLLHHSCA